VKFTERGEVLVTVALGLARWRARLELRLRDTGIGIPPTA